MGSGISKTKIPSIDSILRSVDGSTLSFDFAKFKSILGPNVKQAHDEIILREWFRILDANDNGFIEMAEIDRAKQVMAQQQHISTNNIGALQLLDFVPLGDRTAAHRFAMPLSRVPFYIQDVP